MPSLESVANCRPAFSNLIALDKGQITHQPRQQQQRQRERTRVPMTQAHIDRSVWAQHCKRCEQRHYSSFESARRMLAGFAGRAPKKACSAPCSCLPSPLLLLMLLLYNWSKQSDAEMPKSVKCSSSKSKLSASTSFHAAPV